MNSTAQHRAGFVNILGRPNVGKSTLMNSMVGEKLSIITSKAQTTRHRIHGIVNSDDYQVVFSDTPGILEPNYKLQEFMLKSARGALSDADIFLYITETGEPAGKETFFIERLKEAQVPLLVVINKIDLSDQVSLENLVGQWKELLPAAEIFPVSALKKFNVDQLFRRILELLPESPPFFPKDMLTDKSERFLAGEVIREKILLHYKQEIPYSVEIEVESFKEEVNIIRMRAVIYVERESQKGILIGHKGASLKRVGQEAREEMELFFNKKIFLELYVKVDNDWRNNEKKLKKFGYR
ncbi:MAG: GTPase Era [Bacteroidales bacterium]|nr:GTPase Era [Bacteroidales bacterium]MDT8431834.1 GTPase Era [Bacteroidales bacterium]